MSIKIGEYGRTLSWTLVNQNNEPISDLDDANSIKLYIKLNGFTTEHDCDIISTELGIVSWEIEDGIFTTPGVAEMEISIKYSDGRYITKTIKQIIKERVGTEEIPD